MALGFTFLWWDRKKIDWFQMKQPLNSLEGFATIFLRLEYYSWDFRNSNFKISMQLEILIEMSCIPQNEFHSWRKNPLMYRSCHFEMHSWWYYDCSQNIQTPWEIHEIQLFSSQYKFQFFVQKMPESKIKQYWVNRSIFWIGEIPITNTRY